MAKYRMTFDLHTHTVMKRSDGREILHAKGTVEENVLAAREKGLSCVGISNHGPGHITYGLPEDGLPTLRGQIEEARQKYGDIKILLGVEANIINPSGLLDVKPEDFERFNYVMAGYHYGIFGEEPVNAAEIHGANWIYTNLRSVWNFAESFRGNIRRLGRESFEDRLRRINTELMVAAVRRNRPKVLTHPGDKGPFDIHSIARACQETGTWMEINNYHGDLSAAGIAIAARYDVSFVIGSDAHTPEGVGTFEKALERAMQAGLSPERIVNIEEVKNAARPAGDGGSDSQRESLDGLREKSNQIEKEAPASDRRAMAETAAAAVVIAAGGGRSAEEGAADQAERIRAVDIEAAHAADNSADPQRGQAVREIGTAPAKEHEPSREQRPETERQPVRNPARKIEDRSEVGKDLPAFSAEYAPEPATTGMGKRTDESPAGGTKDGIDTEALLWGRRHGEPSARLPETEKKQRNRYRISEKYRKKDMRAVYKKRRGRQS